MARGSSLRPNPGWEGAITVNDRASSSITRSVDLMPIAGCSSSKGRPVPRLRSSMRTPAISVKLFAVSMRSSMDEFTWRASVRLDAGGLDQFSILLDLSAEETIELRRGHLERLSAQGHEFVLHVFELQRFRGFAVQLLLNVPGGLGGGEDADPEREVGIGVAGFRERRQVRQRRDALIAADGEGKNPSVADERHRWQYRREEEIHPSRQ